MRGSDFLIVTAGVVAVIATVAAAADQTCFPDSDHCKCRRTIAGGTCLRPTGKANDECIEYQCGEGAVCDCLAGTEICSMTTCPTSRYSKLESAVPKSGGIVKCKKVERNLCITLDRPAAAGDVCINDSNCPEGLICNAANACASQAAAAGAPCKVDANCVSGLICNSANVCATPPAAAGDPCKVDANCVSGLICNSANVCATPPAAAGESCKVDANCVSGLICNSANICATPLSNIGGPCTTDAACKDGLICHTLTSACAKKTEFTMRINADDEAWFQVGVGNGPEKYCGNKWWTYYDYNYTGPCGDMFLTISNGNVENPTGLALEITEGGIKYTLMPDSDPMSNKLTALVKHKARPLDPKKDASYDYSANGWTPAIQVLSVWWGNAASAPGLLGSGSNAPQLSVSTNARGAGGCGCGRSRSRSVPVVSRQPGGPCCSKTSRGLLYRW
jgi:hypothetical protein